jgi:hypothetical protein
MMVSCKDTAKSSYNDTLNYCKRKVKEPLRLSCFRGT